MAGNQASDAAEPDKWSLVAFGVVCAAMVGASVFARMHNRVALAGVLLLGSAGVVLLWVRRRHRQGRPDMGLRLPLLDRFGERLQRFGLRHPVFGGIVAGIYWGGAMFAIFSLLTLFHSEKLNAVVWSIGGVVVGVIAGWNWSQARRTSTTR